MNKKLVALICFASTLLIGTAQADWEGNWLLGVTGGFAERDGNLELNMGHPAPGRQVTTVIQNLDESGFIWGLLGGYQVRCNGWLVGGELNIDWRHLDENRVFAFTDVVGVGWNATGSYDQNTAVGLTARLGYEVTPCFMPYLRIGAETSDDTLSLTGLTNAGTLAAFVEGSRRQYRFVGGVGAEMPFPLWGLSFRLEYNYYSKGKGVDATGFATNGLLYVDTTARVRTNAGKASLVYNFL